MTLVMGGGQWIGVMFTYSRNTHEYRLQVTAEAWRRTRGVSRDASQSASPRSPTFARVLAGQATKQASVVVLP